MQQLHLDSRYCIGQDCCYVLCQEYVAPLIALEFASGDGSEERDRTPPPLPDERANRERQRAERLAERLRQMEINSDEV